MEELLSRLNESDMNLSDIDYDDDITDPSYKLPPQKARTVIMPNVDEQHEAAGPSNASILV